MNSIHPTKERPIRASLARTLWASALLCSFAVSTARADERTLFLMHGDADLISLLRGQLVDWEIRLGAGMTPGSASDGAAVSVDGSGERLRAVVEYQGQLRMSPLPERSEPGWERVFTLVVEGLLLECERAAKVAELEQTQLPTIIVVPADSTVSVVEYELGQITEIPFSEVPPPADPSESDADAETATDATDAARLRDGWAIRVGLMHSESPRRLDSGATGRSEYATTTSLWGARASIGRWLKPYLRLDVIGHFGMDEFGDGPEGSIGMQAMYHTRRMLRFGIGLEASLVITPGGHTDTFRPRVAVPIELGFDFRRAGGLYGRLAATVTPNNSAAQNFGYIVSADWEIPFGN